MKDIIQNLINSSEPTNAQQVASFHKAKAEQIAQPFKQTKALEEQTSIISNLKEITEQNIKASQEYNEASKRIAEASLKLSIIAVVITILVGAISIGIGIASFKSSNNWQTQQIPELKAQNIKLQEQNKLLKQLNENLIKLK